MDSTETHEATTAPAASEPTIKVRVVQQGVLEGGVWHLKNQVLNVTPARAAALGNFVVPVKEEATK